MKLPLVTDALWERLEPLLPPASQRRFHFPRTQAAGLPQDPHRHPLCPQDRHRLGRISRRNWAAGCGKTCREYPQTLARSQTASGPSLHAVLLAELNAADQIDWRRALIDASFAKAPAREARIPARNPPRIAVNPGASIMC